jgi:hypothetical protein
VSRWAAPEASKGRSSATALSTAYHLSIEWYSSAPIQMISIPVRMLATSEGFSLDAVPCAGPLGPRRPNTNRYEISSYTPMSSFQSSGRSATNSVII